MEYGIPPYTHNNWYPQLFDYDRETIRRYREEIVPELENRIKKLERQLADAKTALEDQ